MKYHLIFGALLCLLSSLLLAQEQKLHTPAEIMKLVEDSRLAYEIGVLEKPIPPADRSKKLNVNEFYRQRTDSGFDVLQYNPSMASRKLADQAEERFSVKNYTNARTFYKEALRADSNYFKLYTYIGQTFEEEGLLDEAREWYQKAIDKNPIDYMAHWFLADSYMGQKQPVKALHHILLAHLLNRNNPRIEASLKEIFQANKMRYADWDFTPQVELQKKDDQHIEVRANSLWLGYALVRAVWQYEPGFKESQGYERELAFVNQEEKEALMSLHLLAEQEKSVKSREEVQALKKAVDTQLLNEFIIYEIWLPQYPQFAYQLPEDVLERLCNYVKQVRRR